MTAKLTAQASVHQAAGWSDSFDFRKGITTRDLVDYLSFETWVDDDNTDPCQGDCCDAERGRPCRCANVDTGLTITIRPRVFKSSKPSDDLFSDEDLEDLPF